MRSLSRSFFSFGVSLSNTASKRWRLRCMTSASIIRPSNLWMDTSISESLSSAFCFASSSSSSRSVIKRLREPLFLPPKVLTSFLASSSILRISSWMRLLSSRSGPNAFTDDSWASLTILSTTFLFRPRKARRCTIRLSSSFAGALFTEHASLSNLFTLVHL